MTLEETIQNLKESIKNAPNKFEYEKYRQDGLQLLVWLESYKTISESYPEVKKKMDRLEEENMRLLESALRLGKRCETLEAEIKRLRPVSDSEDYKQFKADYIDLDMQLRTANTENDELKRLLRLAVEDIEKLKNCEKYPFCGGCPKESEPLCKWEHHDEAMKLLGGEDGVD